MRLTAHWSSRARVVFIASRWHTQGFREKSGAFSRYRVSRLARAPTTPFRSQVISQGVERDARPPWRTGGYGSDVGTSMTITDDKAVVPDRIAHLSAPLHVKTYYISPHIAYF